MCSSCHGEISEGQALIALEKHWHIWCFKCETCGTILHGEYLNKDGRVYCEKDYQVCIELLMSKTLITLCFRNNSASSVTTVDGTLRERSFRPVTITFTLPAPVAPSAVTFSATAKKCTFRGLPFGIHGAAQGRERSWKCWTGSLRTRWAGVATRLLHQPRMLAPNLLPL